MDLTCVSFPMQRKHQGWVPKRWRFGADTPLIFLFSKHVRTILGPPNSCHVSYVYVCASLWNVCARSCVCGCCVNRSFQYCFRCMCVLSVCRCVWCCCCVFDMEPREQASLSTRARVIQQFNTTLSDLRGRWFRVVESGPTPKNMTTTSCHIPPPPRGTPQSFTIVNKLQIHVVTRASAVHTSEPLMQTHVVTRASLFHSDHHPDPLAHE